MALLACALMRLATGCAAPRALPATHEMQNVPFIVVLGIAQDGGVPHAGCDRKCCAAAWSDPKLRRRVVCLAIVDPQSQQRWIIEATPDFPAQLHALDEIAPRRADQPKPALDGIFLTHGHIGHYAGLVHLGREVLGAKEVPVYAMPRMQAFLEGNGPWDQLVKLGNIAIRPLQADQALKLNDRLTVTPFLVPHRDEYAETVGYRIDGPARSIVFIPDIDKWEKWDRRIEEVVADCDVAYLDGTFFADGELPGRSMAEVPHPFIIESMRRFAPLPPGERAKVRFIHLNHTNPGLREGSEARGAIEQAGFAVAVEGERQPL
jgi:pyrroloquinoline quinone biosynthesis protein B